nr:MSMEG_4193 family putative phosphomutase [Actinomycetota bacterium]
MPDPKAPERTVVLMVRHGRTPTTGEVLPGRASGLHLAAEGTRQAEEAATRLSRLRKVQAVYSSPLERALETASPIAAALGTEVRTEEDLNECDFGEWTGGELKKLAELDSWRTVQQWPSGWRFPGGESFAEMQSRIVACVGRLADRHRGAAFVAVSHADPIKAATAHALGLHLDLFQRLVIAPASVTAISLSASG